MEAVSIDRPVSHINPRDAARILGVSVFTLQNWRAKGRGPAYRKGVGSAQERVYYTPEDLAQYQQRLVRHVPSVVENFEAACGGL